MVHFKNKMKIRNLISRRKFIGQATCAACGTAGMVSALAQLKAVGAMAGDSSRIRNESVSTDYKALVCIFLGGGNDGGNTLIPIDNSSYKSYAQSRAEVALAQNTILQINPKSYSDGRIYGLHPSMPEIKNLFSNGNLAILANVGTLTAPTNLQSYMAGSSIPLQLSLIHI